MTNWTWDATRKVYINADTGAEVGPDELLTQRNALIDHETTLTEALFGLLVGGAVGIWNFERQLIERQNTIYTAQFLLGLGGIAQLTASIRADLNAQLNERQSAVRTFTNALVAGDMTAAVANAYLGGFTNSAQTAYNKGRAAAYNISDLPAWPADGGCACNRRCRCLWEFSETDGGVNAYWRLTSGANHCDDCLSNANTYSPYFIPREGA